MARQAHSEGETKLRERKVHQVVVPPGSDPELVKKIRDKVEPMQKPVDNWTKVRLIAGRILHRVMHTWVVWNEYDPISDRLLVMGSTCMFCSEGRTD